MRDDAQHHTDHHLGITEGLHHEVEQKLQKDFPLTINGLKIDPIIFTQGFVECCDVSICNAECCWYGVYADAAERDTILGMKEQIAAVMDETQTKDWTRWFEPETVDADFLSGRCAGTEVFNNKCVFLDRRGYCSLQVLAVEHGKERWAYKPYYCVLFPLVVVDGVLTFDDDHSARMHHCGIRENFTHTIFEACTDELIYALGRDGYEMLCAHYSDHESTYRSQISFR